MPWNSGPSLAPSDAVLATPLSRSMVVPANATTLVAPTTGARRTSRPSARRPSGASRANSPNHTPKASPCRTHVSTPYRLVPNSWITR